MRRSVGRVSFPVFGEGGRAKRGRVGLFLPGNLNPTRLHASRGATLPEDGEG
jgi:hypothetical protein